MLGAQFDRLPMIRSQVNGATSRMIGGIGPNEQPTGSKTIAVRCCWR